MKWERIFAEPFDGATYTTAEYRSGAWTITREHYAHGPSLFTWVLRDHEGHEDHSPTLAKAKEVADAWASMVP